MIYESKDFSHERLNLNLEGLEAIVTQSGHRFLQTLKTVQFMGGALRGVVASEGPK